LIADTFFAAFAGRAVLPSTVVPPSVSGRPRAGQTLSGVHGAWTGTPTSFRYRWERCDAAGLHCAVVAGASGWTYVVGRADAGDTLRVQEAAVNGAGTGAWATSAATQTVPRPVDPLANAIRAALLSALVPHRGSARVRAVLRTGGHGFSFRAPAAGLASFGWSARPARVGRTVLVARVRHRFRGPARVRLKLRLTRVGHSLLSRLRGGVRIIGLATYSRAGYEPVTVARRFILAR
jgi:hypothetical protein